MTSRRVLFLLVMLSGFEWHSYALAPRTSLLSHHDLIGEYSNRVQSLAFSDEAERRIFSSTVEANCPNVSVKWVEGINFSFKRLDAEDQGKTIQFEIGREITSERRLEIEDLFLGKYSDNIWTIAPGNEQDGFKKTLEDAANVLSDFQTCRRRYPSLLGFIPSDFDSSLQQLGLALFQILNPQHRGKNRGVLLEEMQHQSVDEKSVRNASRFLRSAWQEGRFKGIEDILDPGQKIATIQNVLRSWYLQGILPQIDQSVDLTLIEGGQRYLLENIGLPKNHPFFRKYVTLKQLLKEQHSIDVDSPSWKTRALDRASEDRLFHTVSAVLTPYLWSDDPKAHTPADMIRTRSVQCDGAANLALGVFQALGFEVYWMNVIDNAALSSEGHGAIVVRRRSNPEVFHEYDVAMGRFHDFTSEDLGSEVIERLKQGLSPSPQDVVEVSMGEVGLEQRILAAQGSLRVSEVHYRFQLMHPALGAWEAQISHQARFIMQEKSGFIERAKLTPENAGMIERMLRKAIELNPGNPYTHAHLAELYSMTAKRDDKAAHDKALEAIADAYQIGRWNPMMLHDMGNILLNRGNLQEAIVVLTLAKDLSLDPNVHFSLARAYSNSGDINNATMILKGIQASNVRALKRSLLAILEKISPSIFVSGVIDQLGKIEDKGAFLSSLKEICYYNHQQQGTDQSRSLNQSAGILKGLGAEGITTVTSAFTSVLGTPVLGARRSVLRLVSAYFSSCCWTVTA